MCSQPAVQSQRKIKYRHERGINSGLIKPSVTGQSVYMHCMSTRSRQIDSQNKQKVTRQTYDRANTVSPKSSLFDEKVVRKVTNPGTDVIVP